MSTLKNKAQNILDEKINKIKPSNIKKGIQIFNVTGTYEGSGGGDIGEYFNLVLTDGDRNIIKKYPEIDSSELTNFSYLFANNRTEIIPNLDYSNARDMTSFASASSLTEIPDLSEAQYCSAYNSTFYNCLNITDCSNKVINCACKGSDILSFDYMFQSCENLYIAPMFDFSEAGTGEYNELYVNMSGVFAYNNKLTTIPEILPYTNQESFIKFYIITDIVNYCFNLTKASIENILKLICYCNTDTYYGEKKVRVTGINFRQLDVFSSADLKKYIEDNNWQTGYEDYTSYQIDTKLYDKNYNIVSNNLPELVSYFNDWLWQEEIDSSGIKEYKNSEGVINKNDLFYKNILVNENEGYSPNVVLIEHTRYMEVARIDGLAGMENNTLKFTTGDNVIILIDFTNNIWSEMENADYWEISFSYNAVDENGAQITELSNEQFFKDTADNPIQNKKFAYHTDYDFAQHSIENLKLVINCNFYIDGNYIATKLTIADDDIPEDNSGKVYNVTLDLEEV